MGRIGGCDKSCPYAATTTIKQSHRRCVGIPSLALIHRKGCRCACSPRAVTHLLDLGLILKARESNFALRYEEQLVQPLVAAAFHQNNLWAMQERQGASTSCNAQCLKPQNTSWFPKKKDLDVATQHLRQTGPQCARQKLANTYNTRSFAAVQPSTKRLAVQPYRSKQVCHTEGHRARQKNIPTRPPTGYPPFGCCPWQF